jgi:hypothetical protein
VTLIFIEDLQINHFGYQVVAREAELIFAYKCNWSVKSQDTATSIFGDEINLQLELRLF